MKMNFWAAAGSCQIDRLSNIFVHIGSPFWYNSKVERIFFRLSLFSRKKNLNRECPPITQPTISADTMYALTQININMTIFAHMNLLKLWYAQSNLAQFERKRDQLRSNNDRLLPLGKYLDTITIQQVYNSNIVHPHNPQKKRLYKIQPHIYFIHLFDASNDYCRLSIIISYRLNEIMCHNICLVIL